MWWTGGRNQDNMLEQRFQVSVQLSFLADKLMEVLKSSARFFMLPAVMHALM